MRHRPLPLTYFNFWGEDTQVLPPNQREDSGLIVDMRRPQLDGWIEQGLKVGDVKYSRLPHNTYPSVDGPRYVL